MECMFTNACLIWDTVANGVNGHIRPIIKHPYGKHVFDQKVEIYDPEAVCRSLEIKYLLPIWGESLADYKNIPTGGCGSCFQDNPGEGEENETPEPPLQIGCTEDSECEFDEYCDPDAGLYGCKELEYKFGHIIVDHNYVECADDEISVDNECQKLECNPNKHQKEPVDHKCVPIICDPGLELVNGECMAKATKTNEIDQAILDEMESDSTSETFGDSSLGGTVTYYNDDADSESNKAYKGCSLISGGKANTGSFAIFGILLALIILFRSILRPSS